MVTRSVPCLRLLCQSVGYAVILWLSLATAAAAGARVAADLNGDGRPDHIKVVESDGRHTLALHFAGGSRIWLTTPSRVSQLVAGDVDRDGDIDLLATTERAELIAWINHGRGRFALAPRPAGTNSLLPSASSVNRTSPEQNIDPGLTSDATVAIKSSIPMPGVERSASQYFEPAPLTRQSPPVSPRGPPQA